MTINVFINYDNKQLIQRYNTMLHIFYLYDIVASRNIRICMESHNHNIKKKTRLERLIRFFNSYK